MRGLAGQVCDDAGCYDDTGQYGVVTPPSYICNCINNRCVETGNDCGSPAGITTPPFFGGGQYGSGSTPGGSNFWTAFTQGLRNATSILSTRYSVPQLNPGQIISTGPGGTSFMSQAQTGGAMQLPTSIGGIGTGTIVLIGGAILLFSMMSKKG